MHKLSTYLVVTYFPTFLHISASSLIIWLTSDYHLSRSSNPFFQKSWFQFLKTRNLILVWDLLTREPELTVLTLQTGYSPQHWFWIQVLQTSNRF